MITPLLTTKTYIPPPRATLVPRPRLIERLNASLGRKLTLISAPAGFGKTTLVSEWIQSLTPAPLSRRAGEGTGVRAAWLSLSRHDNDPLQFWRYVIAALQTIDKTIGGAAQAALQTSQPPPPEALVAILINDCADGRHPIASGNERQDSPYILVLDDYHVIESLAIHDSLNYWLDNLPPQLHLVITTREDPPLALPRRRGRAELAEIRVADLRFTAEETAEFLNALAGLNLSREDIAALEKRTEGWIVGLQMAALSLQQQTPLDQHDFVTAFAGDDRYIVDYLVQEVFEHQSPRVQSFLLQTSILERMCGPLCDAVTERNDGQEILGYLEQANLFIIPLDNRRYWYRYHQLFADLLRQRLRLTEDKRLVNALYRRASVWCQQKGLITEAVSYALDASDPEYAATLIERYVLDLFYDSEIALIHTWLKSLPDDLVRARPLLQAVYASTTALIAGWSTESLELAERWLQEAEKTLATQEQNAGITVEPGRPTRDEVLGFMSKFRAYMSRVRGDAPQTVIRLSQQALERLPKDERKFRSALLTNMGFTHQLVGDEDAAFSAYVEAARAGELSGDLFNFAAATKGQAAIHRSHGRLREAAAICREGLKTINSRSEALGRQIPYAGVVYITLGEITLEWNDLEEANRLLTQGVTLIKLLPDFAVAEGYIALARLERAQGDIEKALELLEQAERLYPARAAYVAVHRLQFWLAQADDDPDKLALIAQRIQERQVTLESEQPRDPLKHLEQTTLHRLLIAQHRAHGQPDLHPLLDCLDRQIHSTRKKEWNEWAIEFLILRALALHAQDSIDQAVVSLRQALTLAEPGGYVRVFLDEGAPMKALLQKATVRRTASQYASDLLAAFSSAPSDRPRATAQDRPPHAGAPAPPLIEPLSPREIEVLRLVATGATNPQIAQRLFITVDTVKKHLSNIFGKLGVKNRTQAVARARELGLLE
jgi:LuxR family maltose regulon positive regulatory protein